jgi:site-specific recombinase XerD
MVARLGVAAKLGYKAHPHMFRHACGFQLANQGTDTRTLQAYLGHRNIQHTVRYTELSPARFKNLWRDRGSLLIRLRVFLGHNIDCGAANVVSTPRQ